MGGTVGRWVDGMALDDWVDRSMDVWIDGWEGGWISEWMGG